MSETIENIPHMVPICKAAELTGLSYEHIRKLCINDQIVYIRVGKKYMVNMDMLIEFLNTGAKKQPAKKTEIEQQPAGRWDTQEIQEIREIAKMLKEMEPLSRQIVRSTAEILLMRDQIEQRGKGKENEHAAK